MYLKLKDMKTITSEFAVASKKLLQTPLPVAYEGTAASSGSNVASIVTVGGGAFDAETMTGSNTNVGAALESEVLVPLKKWLDTFKSVDASVKPVEDLRLEVDSRRHTVADLSAQVDKLRVLLRTRDLGAVRVGSVDDYQGQVGSPPRDPHVTPRVSRLG